MTIKIGAPAPEITLPLDDGRNIHLSDIKGEKAVLYFYPKDDTPGCTKEACGFRDALPDFSKIGAIVIGISRDDAKKHTKFKQKYELNFPLATDEDGKICEAFGVWVEKSMYGKKYMGIDRSTFLIDEQGNIKNIWRSVKVDGHVNEVLAAVRE